MIVMSENSEPDITPNKQLVNLIEQLFSQLRIDKTFFQLNLNLLIQPSTKSVLKDLIYERATHLLESVKTIFKMINSENYELLSYVFIAELDGVALDYLTVFENYPLDKLEEYLINKYGK